MDSESGIGGLSPSLSLSLSPQLRGGGQVVVRRTRLHAETSRQIYTQLKNWDAEGSEYGTPLREMSYDGSNSLLIRRTCHTFSQGSMKLYTGLVKRIWSKVAVKHWIVIAQAVSCCLLP